MLIFGYMVAFSCGACVGMVVAAVIIAGKDERK